MNSFEILFKLIVNHSFYSEGSCPILRIQPDAATERLLHNYTYCFIRLTPNEWAILGEKGNSTPAGPLRDLPALRFQLSFTDAGFLYYTIPAEPAVTSETPIRCHSSQTSHSRQEIVCDHLLTDLEKATDAPLVCTLTYTAARRYWEYLLIPRTGTLENRSIFLSDTENIFRFGAAEPVQWNGTQIYRIRTEHPVDLHSSYPPTIQLYEKKSFGTQSRETVKKLLCKNVSPPSPAQLADGRKDTIQHILYF